MSSSWKPISEFKNRPWDSYLGCQSWERTWEYIIFYIDDKGVFYGQGPFDSYSLDDRTMPHYFKELDEVPAWDGRSPPDV